MPNIVNTNQNKLYLENAMKIAANSTKSIKQLEEEYNSIVENNNWKDTDESLILKDAYRIHENRPDCLECGSKANIDCQYH